MSNQNTSDTGKNEIDIAIPEKALKKDKKYIEKTIYTANIIIIGLIFIAIFIFLLIGKRPVTSETENRNLSKFPKFSASQFFNGEYTNDISEYFNDTVPFRSAFKDMTANFRSCMGIKHDGVIIYGGIGGIKDGKKTISAENTETTVSEYEANTETTTPETTVTSKTTSADTETSAEPNNADDNLEEGILSGGILVYKNRGIPVYYGSFETGQNYAGYVNAYKADLGNSVNIYSLIAPTSQSFYMPEKYAVNYGSESDNLANIRQFLNGVTEIDAYTTLLSHKNEAIYSRTDHHWAPLGAYYASQEFTKKANVPFAELSAYEKVVVPNYVGTLYGWSQVADLKNNPEDFIYYKPQNQYTTTYYTPSFNLDHEGPLLIEAYGSSMYCTFMGSDEFIVHVSTDQKNGRTLAVIKDSYGNAMIPFLTSSFENIYVIDIRYFNLNAIAFLREHGVTDVLFAMNTFSATGSNAKYIEQIRTQ